MARIAVATPRGTVVREVDVPSLSAAERLVPSPVAVAELERRLKPGQVLQYPRPDPPRFGDPGRLRWDDALALARTAVRHPKAPLGPPVDLYNALRDRYQRTNEALPAERRVDAATWLAATNLSPLRPAHPPPLGLDHTPGGLRYDSAETATRRRVVDRVREAFYDGATLEMVGADGAAWDLMHSPDDPRTWAGDLVLMPRDKPAQLARLDSPESVAYRVLQIFGPNGPARFRLIPNKSIDPLARFDSGARGPRLRPASPKPVEQWQALAQRLDRLDFGDRLDFAHRGRRWVIDVTHDGFDVMTADGGSATSYKTALEAATKVGSMIGPAATARLLDGAKPVVTDRGVVMSATSKKAAKKKAAADKAASKKAAAARAAAKKKAAADKAASKKAAADARAAAKKKAAADKAASKKAAADARAAAKKKAAPCKGSIAGERRRVDRLAQRVEQRIADRAARAKARHGREIEALRVRQSAAIERAQAKGPRAATARRVAALRSAHARALKILEAKHRAELSAIPRAVECAAIGRVRAARAVRLGCGTLCGLNLPGAVGGDATTVAVQSARGTPRELPARFVVVSAASLIPSHNAQTFDPRPDYPDATQERRYERDSAEKLKVIDVAQNMRPGLIVNTNIGAVDGTPIVDRGGIVLSGNGRTMGAQRHYASGRRVLAEYILRHAAQFGVGPAKIRHIVDPIVVRLVDVAVADRPRLVRDFNVPLTQSMSARDEADALARQLPADAPRILAQTLGDLSLVDYFASRASLPLVGALERSGWIHRGNRGRVLGDDGLVAPGARDEVAALLAASVLPRDVGARSAEAERAIARSAPQWLVAAGAGPEWDIRPQIAAAVEDLGSLRASGMCLARWLQQVSIERPRTDGNAIARLLLEILDLAAARPTVIAKIAASFAAASRGAGGLFGGAEPLSALRDAAAAAGVTAAKATSKRRCSGRAT